MNIAIHSIKRHLRGIRLRMVLVLVPFLAAVYFVAHWLRFEDQLTAERIRQFAATLFPLLAVKICCLASFGVYQGWGRYVTFHDLVALVKASTAAAFIFALIDYLLFPATNLPRSIFIMDWAGTVAVIGVLRSFGRLRQEITLFSKTNEKMTAALIVGANDEGEALLRNLRRIANLDYRVLGFMSSDRELVGTYIGGVPVLGTLDETWQVARWHHAEEILVTSGSIGGKQLRDLVDEVAGTDVTVKVLPSYEQIIDGKVDLKPRKVCIEDLLRREPVQLDQDELRHWIDGNTLLVTGSAGSIGSEICRQLLRFRPKRLVCVDRWECGQFFLEKELAELASGTDIELAIADVSDRTRMNALLELHRPDVIFHAAAYKHVPLMEANAGEAVKNIVRVSQQLADLAIEHDVGSFVMISTDKAVNPTNVMGACKRVAELYVQSLTAKSNTRFVTVRFGNVLDSAGSVIPIFRQQIADGGPVTVTDPEMTRYFMTIPEASQLVIQAGAMGHGGEIFVLDMGSPVKIVDLAEDMIQLSGLKLEEDIEIRFVGCRPGEKLYEELHVDGERHVATAHPKIMVAESNGVSRLEALRAVRRLENLADGPREFILEELGRAVPQFQHADHTRQPTRRAA
jgi:FlaA1/EpsC-like NDP-sugar epimerase